MYNIKQTYIQLSFKCRFNILTILALWKRIKTPELILSSEIKKLIWDIICIVEEIDCYILDEPRPELVIRDELDTADIIKGKKVNEVRITKNNNKQANSNFFILASR